MNRFLLVLIFFALTTKTYAQSLDSSRQKLDSVRTSLQKQSLQQTTNAASKLDSLSSLASVQRYTDSLKINVWSDNLRSKINFRFSEQSLTSKMDSLRSRGVPAGQLTHLSDSIMGKKQSLLNEVGTKQQALHEKVLGRHKTAMETLRTKFNLDSAGVKLPGMDPSISDPLQKLNIPSANLPNTSLPDTKLPSASIPEVPGIPSLSTNDFSSLGLSKDLTDVGGDVSIPSTEQLTQWDKSLPGISDPMKQVTDGFGEIKSMTNNPSQAAESAVGNVSEVNAATKELAAAEQLKSQADAANIAGNPEAMKEAAKDQALNHFAGQEAALQGAMSQMAKYKKKYTSLGSLSEIKKNDWLPRNGLKGRPFKERFRVGMNIGVKSLKDTLLLDFYPNASYRITGRIEAGLGAIYRVRVVTKDFGFDQRNPVWGMSAFTVIKTFKSVFLRVELDGNSFPKANSADAQPYRDWRWSLHSGIQTNFKISKQWSGNVQMLYNFDFKLKDGFPEKLTLRTGVQYKLK